MYSMNTPPEHDPLWYKDAVIYQLHIKTFLDSSGDGIGDFRGLTRKLDYLKNLGVSAIWLLPFYPSPLKDDGYDISDYYDVHPKYGTLKDFREFLREAHHRGLRVITELVINHTSDQHPWFQRARRAQPHSNHRDYYVWSDTPERYPDARVIFGDFEQSNWTWDERAKAYFWHRFYSHQPDLNFENPDVQEEILRIADFWLDLGVDGLRLDAVPYLFEREGTNCENLPETHEFLKKLRRHIDSGFPDRMLLAEANQWPEDAAAYFGCGDECQMAFHFPIMPRVFMSLQMEDRFPIVDILDQTPDIPSNCQWAVFLRNHDELTLEMVTDEERDYMYRAYAKDSRSKINSGIRRRLAPLLGNNRRKIELANILLFSLPGTPVLYYGDEIGMGDNRFLGDRDGVRTPMQWSPDRNAGFSRVNPQELYLPVVIDSEYHYETINVETQENNLSSPLWWMRRVIAMRRKLRAFSRGTTVFLMPDDSKVLGFLRILGSEIILVVVNLSRYAQSVELDLKGYRDYVPEEIFSQNAFPRITADPYPMTLGPYSHFWFILKKSDMTDFSHIEQGLLRAENPWPEIFLPDIVHRLDSDILPAYLKRCRWFDGGGKRIRSVHVSEVVPSDAQGTRIAILIVQVATGPSETYLLPLSFVGSKEDPNVVRDFPQSIICRLSAGGAEGYLYDGLYDRAFHRTLFELITQKKRISRNGSVIAGFPGKRLKSLIGDHPSRNYSSKVLKHDRSNTSIVLDNGFFMKVFRKLDEGVHPETELSRFLSEQKKFGSAPAYAGSIEFHRAGTEPMTMAVLQGHVQAQSDAWDYATDQVRSYLDRALAAAKGGAAPHAPAGSGTTASAAAQSAIDPLFVEMIERLGRRTAEMHLLLASAPNQADWTPEPFTFLYQRSIYQSMGSQARLLLAVLRRRMGRFPPEIQREISPILESERAIRERFQLILRKNFTAKRIRIHGDYHLGQVLFTGKDFVITDFEGDPTRPISERRIKRSVLRDIAGMMWSFHCAAYFTLFHDASLRDVDIAVLETAARNWRRRTGETFLKSYIESVGKEDILPKDPDELDMLLRIYMLDRALHAFGHAIDSHADRIIIAARGILHILAQDGEVPAATEGKPE